MAEYEIGYGKPPKSGRFKPGRSGNPKGRPKRKPTPLAERINDILNAPIEYRERGRTKVTTRYDLCLTILVERAANGDLGAAEGVLKIRARAERYGDTDIEILVRDWLPDYAGQTAEQKNRAHADSQDAQPVEWWRPSDD